MIKRINHIGIVVSNLDETLKLYERAFGLKPAAVKDAIDDKVRVAFTPVGDDEIELLQPVDPNIPLGRFLQTHGQGIHHISIATDEIDSQVHRMKSEGVAFADERPKPETTGRVTVEPCEEELD